MKTIKEFSLYFISANFEFDKHQEIKTNIKNSEVIMINNCNFNNQKETFFIICFKKTLLVFNLTSSLSLLNQLFTFSNSPICIIPDSKDIFNTYVKFKIQNPIIEYDKYPLFFAAIEKFCDKILIKSKLEQQNLQILESIKPCISGYLIQESYEKLNQNQNTKTNFSKENNKSFEIKVWNKKEYIELGTYGSGSSFCIELIYHIERRELFGIKKPYWFNDIEIEKLTNREIQNYKNLKHPLLPKLYGYANDE